MPGRYAMLDGPPIVRVITVVVAPERQSTVSSVATIAVGQIIGETKHNQQGAERYAHPRFKA